MNGISICLLPDEVPNDDDDDTTDPCAACLTFAGEYCIDGQTPADETEGRCEQLGFKTLSVTRTSGGL